MPGLRIQPHFAHHPNDLLLPRLHAERGLMHPQPFFDNLLHVKTWIQGGVWILKYHLHPVADGQHLTAIPAMQRLTIKHNLPSGGNQAQQRQPGSAFTGAGLAYQPKAFTGAQVEADVF